MTAFLLLSISALFFSLPLYYPDLYFLSWFALFPFLIVQFKAIDQPLNRIFIQGTVWGFLLACFSVNFLYYPLQIYTNFKVLVLLLILMLLFILLTIVYGLFFLFYYFLTFRILKLKEQFNPYLFAVSWVIFEFIRYHLFFFFPFLNPAYTQASCKFMVQLAGLGGIWSLTLAVILINALFFKFYLKQQKRDLLAILLVFLLIFSYGSFNLEKYKPAEFAINQTSLKDFRPKKLIKVGLITSRIRQSDKWRADQINNNFNLITMAAEKLNSADLIITPETALTIDLNKDNYFQQKFLTLVKENFAFPLQVGSLASQNNLTGNQYFNSIFLIDSAGQFLDRYNKVKLVYGGEYFPLERILNKVFSEFNFNSLAEGDEIKIFNYNNLQWKTVICSEILYPDFVKKQAAQVQFIVNETNEAWFANSRLLKNIMWQAAVLRAVENRKIVIKTGNLAYSGIIYPDGSYQKVSDINNYHLLKFWVKK